MIFKIKKASTLFTIVCSVSLFFFIACNQKIKTVDNGIIFKTISEDKNYSINGKESKLNGNLKISFVYPEIYKTKAEKLKSLQKIFIEKVFTEAYVNLSPQEAVDSFSNRYMHDFNELCVEDFFDEDYRPEDEVNFLFYLNIENKIIYNQNNFVSFTVENASYNGGAHGSHSISGYVIDLNTHALLTEDAFAGINYTKNLSPIIIRKIAEANGLKETEQLENIGYNNINGMAPNGNFTLDDKGITYYFNEYEIAAYSVGITKVFIPYKEFNVYIAGNSPIAKLAGL
ncbi:MAG: DUF3298 and DUF4163 domain-containing protein [Dysgonamonadaceae bacterium]|jgi:hypothetical protein|nr:DUF3298 and DUF4163 domain-containing protein [Dysgonamonadaceae bacterium]